MSERLRRLEVSYERRPIYFVTACTAARRELLASNSIHEAFLRFVEESSNRGAWVGRYVLMPDHLHLFVALEDERIRLSAWTGSLKKSISKALRDRGEPSPHWQKVFFDHIMRRRSDQLVATSTCLAKPRLSAATGFWSGYAGEELFFPVT